MTTLIIYISKDRKVQRILKTTGAEKPSDPTKKFNYFSLAKDLCHDCGDEFHGCEVIND